MEQKDYLLREIEKIGKMLRKLFDRKGNLAITLESQMEATKDKLLNEINFDLDKISLCTFLSHYHEFLRL